MGDEVGWSDGTSDGCSVMGFAIGKTDGPELGDAEGSAEELTVGSSVASPLVPVPSGVGSGDCSSSS